MQIAAITLDRVTASWPVKCLATTKAVHVAERYKISLKVTATSDDKMMMRINAWRTGMHWPPACCHASPPFQLH
jgi:hypothetical protein